MTAEVEVLNPGIFSSVQDLGRFGFMAYGVSESGVMDSYAAQLANLLLKNPKDAAVLEVTLLGPKLQFSDFATIAITGGDLSPQINGKQVENNHILQLEAGDILSFGKRNIGCRAYLAIAGGFLTEKVFNSRSWYDGITSYCKLEKGMKLPYINSEQKEGSGHSSVKPGEYLTTSSIEAFPGPEFFLLEEQQKRQLQIQPFHIGKNNNRMGIQLADPLNNSLKPILTGPVLPGTVQLTPSGTLIVLMKDGQTTGGYPRILQLTEAGINSMAQKVMGDKIQFFLYDKEM